MPPGPPLGLGAIYRYRCDDLRITRVFSCVARGFKARSSFMFVGCCWWPPPRSALEIPFTNNAADAAVRRDADSPVAWFWLHCPPG